MAVRGGTYRCVVVGSEDSGADLEEALGALRLLSRIAEQKPLVDERVLRLVVNQADVTLQSVQSTPHPRFIDENSQKQNLKRTAECCHLTNTAGRPKK